MDSTLNVDDTISFESLKLDPTWEFWYPIAERFDDEGESGAPLERPGLAKLHGRIEAGDVHRVTVYRVDRLTRKLSDLARLAERFERRSRSVEARASCIRDCMSYGVARHA